MYFWIPASQRVEKYFDGLFDVVSFSDHFSGPGIALQNFNTLNPRTVMFIASLIGRLCLS